MRLRKGLHSGPSVDTRSLHRRVVTASEMLVTAHSVYNLQRRNRIRLERTVVEIEPVRLVQILEQRIGQHPRTAWFDMGRPGQRSGQWYFCIGRHSSSVMAIPWYNRYSGRHGRAPPGAHLGHRQHRRRSLCPGLSTHLSEHLGVYLISISTCIIPVLGLSRYRRARRAAGQLAAAGDGARPTKQLPIAETLLARGGTLVAMWVRPITSEPLPAAVVARLRGRLHRAHGDASADRWMGPPGEQQNSACMPGRRFEAERELLWLFAAAVWESQRQGHGDDNGALGRGRQPRRKSCSRSPGRVAPEQRPDSPNACWVYFSGISRWSSYSMKEVLSQTVVALIDIFMGQRV